MIKCHRCQEIACACKAFEATTGNRPGDPFYINKETIVTTQAPMLTKREWFAGLAMQGMCANSIPGAHHTPSNTAVESVQYADALIAELEKAKE